MSTSLPLVIAVVNLVDEALQRGQTLDIPAEAHRLQLAHPEADTSAEEIAAMLRHQQEVARRQQSPGTPTRPTSGDQRDP